MKEKIGIIADSSAGLIPKDFTDMPNLGFCPLLITFSDQKTFNDIPSELSEDEFNDRITNQKQFAKTSQTTPGKMMDVWKQMLEKYEFLIFIPLSKGLSGQYGNALMLSQEPEFKDKVYVYDSDGVAIINYLIVKKAYEMTKDSSLEFVDIISALDVIKNSYKAFIVPNDIGYLARGGRISKTAAALANSLKLKPILTFDGTIDKFDTTRTFKKAIIKSLNQLEKFQKQNRKKLILYVVDAGATQTEIDEVLTLANEYNFSDVRVCKLANVITAHTGIGAFALVAFNLDPNQIIR